MGKQSVKGPAIREHVAQSKHCTGRKGRPKSLDGLTRCPRCERTMKAETLKKHFAKSFAKQDDALRHLIKSGKFMTLPCTRKLCVDKDSGMCARRLHVRCACVMCLCDVQS